MLSSWDVWVTLAVALAAACVAFAQPAPYASAETGGTTERAISAE